MLLNIRIYEWIPIDGVLVESLLHAHFIIVFATVGVTEPSVTDEAPGGYLYRSYIVPRMKNEQKYFFDDTRTAGDNKYKKQSQKVRKVHVYYGYRRRRTWGRT